VRGCYVGIEDALIDQAERDLAARPAPSRMRDPRFTDLFTPEYAREVAQTWMGRW
jgi:hypothetical protein